MENTVVLSIELNVKVHINDKCLLSLAPSFDMPYLLRDKYENIESTSDNFTKPDT
jgi:hypothetical protein